MYGSDFGFRASSLQSIALMGHYSKGCRGVVEDEMVTKGT